MKNKGLILVSLALASTAGLRGDTISQTTPEGKVQVIQRDAIVVRQDSDSLTYKHFDLKERRVVKVTLQKGSLPYHILTSSPPRRQGIVVLWKKFGFATTVTDQAGRATRVYDAFLDFYPPGGRGSLLESVPARTGFPLLLPNGAADELDFEKVLSVEVKGDHLQLLLRNATEVAGQFLPPTNLPVETRFMGITDRYDPASDDVFDFSLPLGKIQKIEFEH